MNSFYILINHFTMSQDLWSFGHLLLRKTLRHMGQTVRKEDDGWAGALLVTLAATIIQNPLHQWRAASLLPMPFHSSEPSPSLYLSRPLCLHILQENLVLIVLSQRLQENPLLIISWRINISHLKSHFHFLKDSAFT